MHPGYFIGLVLLVSLASAWAMHLRGETFFDPDDPKQVELRARTTLAALKPGAPIDEVLGPLGAPDFTQMFTVDGQTWRVLRYRTHRVHADGETTRDETTPVIFRDGLLIGIGDEAIAYLPTATQAAITER